MGQVLHGGATTTAAVRRAIQHSQESLRGLAKRYGINPKTVAKWRSAASSRICRPGRSGPVHRAVRRGRGRRGRLSSAYPAAAGRLPVCPAGHHPASDAVVAAPLSATARHLPAARVESATPASASSRPTRSATSTSTSPRSRPHRAGSICWSPSTGHQVRLRRAARKGHTAYRRRLPARPHQGRALHDPHRADRQRHALHLAREHLLGSRRDPARHGLRELFRAHAFEYACAQNHIDHRLTKPRHPWTNGQVERMNRTLKEATVKRFHYDTTTSSAAPQRLRRRLQLRPAAEDPQGPHPLRSHLQSLDIRAKTIHARPAPPNAGTGRRARRCSSALRALERKRHLAGAARRTGGLERPARVCHGRQYGSPWATARQQVQKGAAEPGYRPVARRTHGQDPRALRQHRPSPRPDAARRARATPSMAAGPCWPACQPCGQPHSPTRPMTPTICETSWPARAPSRLSRQHHDD